MVNTPVESIMDDGVYRCVGHDKVNTPVESTMDDGVYRCVGHDKTRSTHLWKAPWMVVCIGVLVMTRQGQHTCGKHYG